MKSLRQLRDDRKETQQSLGKKLGKSHKTISGYEKGNPIPEEILESYARVLGISLDEIRALQPIKEDAVPYRIAPAQSISDSEVLEWMAAHLDEPTIERLSIAALHARKPEYMRRIGELFSRRDKISESPKTGT